jgi:hypothetical protein
MGPSGDWRRLYLHTNRGREEYQCLFGELPCTNNLSKNAHKVIKLGTGRQNRLDGSNNGKQMSAFATIPSESEYGSSSQD